MDTGDSSTSAQPVLQLAPSSNGRVSGKAWKDKKTATVRSHLPDGLRTRSFQERMERTKRERATKKLAQELQDETAQEKARKRAVTQERKKAAAERARLEQAKATMSAAKAARLKKRMGRSKKVHG
ncbi:hypothetical protein EXIGLDRAFT_759691 [Exidia glandulosa HHB12029]|uniref:rRNA-processing protein n=1 Tax=Exidia glandulosa HHB12029 TaxID=1314781 RepID=A0A165PRC0_EXIGL|nr:hypothetical protein EXIGLDRAFT_759691 [Exidia glandulosa HHB12029]